MKKLFLSMLAVVLFGATSALACDDCGCADKGAKKVKTLADGEKTSCATKEHDKKAEKAEHKDHDKHDEKAEKAEHKDHDKHDEKAEKAEKAEHNH